MSTAVKIRLDTSGNVPRSALRSCGGGDMERVLLVAFKAGASSPFLFNLPLRACNKLTFTSLKPYLDRMSSNFFSFRISAKLSYLNVCDAALGHPQAILIFNPVVISSCEAKINCWFACKAGCYLAFFTAILIVSFFPKKEPIVIACRHAKIDLRASCRFYCVGYS